MSPTLRNLKLPSYRFAAILAALIATALICLWAIRQEPHSRWGRVHRSEMTLAGQSDRIAHWIDEHSPIPLKLSDKNFHSNGSMYLTVGTNRLWWDMNDPDRRTGWLMFWHPFTANAVWEFGLCGKTNLMEVGPSDLNTAFIGLADSRGPTFFGTNWSPKGNGIRVSQGEIVLARRTGQMYPVYVIRLKRQPADDFGITEIEYLVVPMDRSRNKIPGANAGESQNEE